MEGNTITVFMGKKEPKAYDLDSFSKDCVRFGRGEFHGNDQSTANDIAVPSEAAFVSRAHCVFRKTGEGWCICDAQSVNGLRFNGVKIQSQQMHDGDKFYIGTNVEERCVLAFSSGGRKAAEMDKILLEGKERYVIGRGSDCEVWVDHPSVSRRHCVITSEKGAYYIEDNHSTNGVVLNGRPLEKKQKLEQMDKIMVAGVCLVFCDNYLYFMETSGGVSVAANEVTKKVKTKKGEKCITDNVSLSISPGEFVAIIGGSGAGKTTLLNCLSGMTDFQSGDVLVNGESIRANKKSIRSFIGYVPQSDIVYGALTLERMLRYSARLRMPKDTSREEIDKKIEEVLEMVELTEHRGTIISRLSGGQRKRASIAVELLASPRLFFLDEPSSGLDPGTEKKLMLMLRELARSGKTVVMVTHTVQNIDVCDRVICMGSGGLLCYSGTPGRALEFFGKESMTDVYEELNEHSRTVSGRFRAEENSLPPAGAVQEAVRQKNRPDLGKSWMQFCVMTRRYAEIILNARGRLLLLLLLPVVLALLVCVAFQADGNLYNYLGIAIDRTSLPFLVGSDTMSLLFAFSCAAFWVGIFNSVQEISRERNIYEREQFTGVGSFSYLMSKFVVLCILCLVQTVILTGLFAFLTDTTATIDGNMHAATALELHMRDGGIVFTGSLWAELFLTTFLTLISAMCLGLAISAAAANEMALVICPVFLLPQILFSGVAASLSGITEILSKIVTCRWACIAYFTSAGVNDMLLSCTYDTGSWNKTEYDTGFGIDEAYSSYKTYLAGFNPVISSWLMLLILAAVCLGLALVFLYVRQHKRK